jgi:protein-S-isoprenylcysteine O-methyltransferase Ste14
MWLKTVHFFSLFFATLALVPSMAHLLELPNKIGLGRDEYLTVQQIYRGWDLLGIVVFGAIFSALALTIMTRKESKILTLSLAALVCLIGTQVVFWWFTYPANQATNNWTELPANWEVLRRNWEYSHAVGAGLNLVAFVLLLAAAFGGFPELKLSRSFLQVLFSIFFLLILSALLMLLAGDQSWTEGWIFSALFFLLNCSTVIYLYAKDPELLNERFGSPVQSEQKNWDKILTFFLIIGFVIWFVIMPLDARRFGWSPAFHRGIKVLGGVLYVLSSIVFFNAYRENTFAAPVVKMQRERGQKVISTGLYGIVRHPMYLGGTLLFIGVPLLLGSVYGLGVGIMLSVVLALRSIGEEEMLRQELAGYDDYMKKVRWRLLPFVF